MIKDCGCRPCLGYEHERARALELLIKPRNSTYETEEKTCKERRCSQSQSCSYISCLVYGLVSKLLTQERITYRSSMAFSSAQTSYNMPPFDHTDQECSLRQIQEKARPVPSSKPTLYLLGLGHYIRHRYSDGRQDTTPVNIRCQSAQLRFRQRKDIPDASWLYYYEVWPTHLAVK